PGHLRAGPRGARSGGARLARVEQRGRSDGVDGTIGPVTTATNSDPVIRVSGLRKRYGETQAVAGVSFEVAAGTVFALLGPNGAGKTTTVEVLEGLRTPDEGDVQVLGVDAVRHPDELKPRIGVSLQTAALYPKLTVTEVLDLFRSFYPRGRDSASLVELMDLGEK